MFLIFNLVFLPQRTQRSQRSIYKILRNLCLLCREFVFVKCDIIFFETALANEREIPWIGT